MAASGDGKAPLPPSGFHNGNPGSTPQGLVEVQPPRREDLQPSYAQTLQGDADDANTHGWYGAMSEFALRDPERSFVRCLKKFQSTRLVRV